MGDDEEVLVYKPYWAHLNQIGAPVRLTDADGAVVWAAEYEPFGKTVALDEDPDGDDEAVTMNFRFPGQYYDAETSLHYNWHRYYDPTAGRYLQAESGMIFKIPLKSTLRRELSYTYTVNNPLVYYDLNGFWYIDVNVSAGGITGGVMFDGNGMTPYVGGYFPIPFSISNILPSASVSFSPNNVSSGWAVAVVGFLPLFYDVGPGGSVGYSDSFFFEYGIGTPGSYSPQVYWAYPTTKRCDII